MNLLIPFENLPEVISILKEYEISFPKKWIISIEEFTWILSGHEKHKGLFFLEKLRHLISFNSEIKYEIEMGFLKRNEAYVVHI